MSNSLDRGVECFSAGARAKVLAAASVAVLLSIALLYDTRILYLLFAGIFAVVLVGKPRAVLFILVSFALLRLDAWMSSRSSLPFGKVLFLFTTFSIVSLALFTSYRLNRFSRVFLMYLAFLVVYLAFGLIGSSGEAPKLWIADTLYALSYLAAIYLIVDERGKLEDVLGFIVLLGAFTSMVNIYEFMHPYTFVLSHSTGRAAGLLKNANTSAFIVNVSFIASIYILRTAESGKRVLLTMLLQGLMFLGVFVTFSREGLLVFALAFLVQLFTTGKKRAAVIFFLVLLLAASSALTVKYITSSSVVDVQRSFAKISSFLSGEIDDNDRLYLLRYHMDRFLRHPLTGNGLYSALIYSVPEAGRVGNDVPNGPHNMFALILSEAGVFPAAVYLVFLMSIFFRLIRRVRVPDESSKALGHVLLMLFSALFIHHFFSHMIIFSRYAMVLFALFLLPDRVYEVK